MKFLNIGHCEACHSFVDKIIDYRRPGEWNEDFGKFDESSLKLCSLCAYTPIGAIKKDEVKKLFGTGDVRALTIDDLGKSISYIGNEILKAINELKGDK